MAVLEDILSLNYTEFEHFEDEYFGSPAFLSDNQGFRSPARKLP